MKLALTIFNGRIAPLFDVAKKIMIIEKDDEKIINSYEHDLKVEDLNDKLSFFKSNEIDEIICGAISKQACMFLLSNKITVHSFIAGETEELVKAWAKGGFDKIAFSMPGCRNRKGQGGMPRANRHCKNRGFRRRNCIFKEM